MGEQITFGGSNTRPTITLTEPTLQPTYTTNADSINIAGTTTDDIGIVSVTWSNDQGGSGTAKNK